METNIAGIKSAAETMLKLVDTWKKYKTQIDVDAEHIQQLGIDFFDIDKKIGEMQKELIPGV